MKQLLIRRTAYFLTALLCSFGLAMGQTTIHNLDFESSGGYSTSITEFTDGDYDYFIRTDGSNITGESFTNIQGSYYFAAQDIDGEGASLPVTLTIDDVDISGYSSLQLKVYLAEDDDGSNQDWDSEDYVHFDYDIDNSGTFSNLLHVEGSNGTNTAPFIDTDFDGTGDGTEITSTFTQFTADISGTGSLLDIQIEFNLDSGDEDIAIDNIEIVEPLVKAEPTNYPTSFTATTNGYDQIDLTWSDNDGSQAADGFLVVGKTGAGSYYSPSDGTEPSDDTDWSDNEFEVKVSHGTQSYSATGLDAETQYDFKIYPYTNSGSNIDYKTDGTVPSASATTGAAPDIPALFISEVVDPSDEANAKFVELYNNSGSTIDFSNQTWYLSRQANGGATSWGDVQLEGTLNHGSTYVIAYSQSTFEASYPTAADLYNGNISGNGDDGYFLYYGGDHSSGTLADAYGVIDQDGTGEAWEYEDSRAIRGTNQTVTEGNATWTASEWTISSATTSDATPGTIENDQSLPVTLTSFTAEVKAGAVQLSWVTESEIRNQGFIVERKSSEPGEFTELSSFKANPELRGAGSTSERNTYSYTDTKVKPEKTYWYRLTDVSFSGKAETHDDRVLKVTVSANDWNQIEVLPAHPNPFNAQTRLSYHLPEKSEVLFELYNIRGVRITTLLQQEQPAGNHDLYISLPEYSSGVYFVRMAARQFHSTQKIVLVK